MKSMQKYIIKLVVLGILFLVPAIVSAAPNWNLVDRDETGRTTYVDLNSISSYNGNPNVVRFFVMEKNPVNLYSMLMKVDKNQWTYLEFGTFGPGDKLIGWEKQPLRWDNYDREWPIPKAVLSNLNGKNSSVSQPLIQDNGKRNSNLSSGNTGNESSIAWKQTTFRIFSYLKIQPMITLHKISINRPKDWTGWEDCWPGGQLFVTISPSEDGSSPIFVSQNTHREFWDEEPSRCHDITPISTFLTNDGMKANMYEAVRNEPMNGVSVKRMAMSFSSQEEPSFRCYVYFTAPVEKFAWYKENVFIPMAKSIKVDFNETENF